MNAQDAEIERLKQENRELRKRIIYLVDRPVPEITRSYITRLKEENEKLSQQVKVLKRVALKGSYAVAQN